MACMSILMLSFRPPTKQVTCWGWFSFPTRLRSFSNWIWYSRTEPICLSLVRSPKKSSNSVGPYFEFNPSLSKGHVTSFSSSLIIWYHNCTSPCRWYIAKGTFSSSTIFWNSKNRSTWQTQLVWSSLPLKREKSSLVTFGIIAPWDSMESWDPLWLNHWDPPPSCELSPCSRLWPPNMWSNQVFMDAIAFIKVPVTHRTSCLALQLRSLSLPLNSWYVNHPWLALIPSCYDHLNHDYHHVYHGELWCLCCNKLNKEDKFGFSSRKNQTSQLANLLNNILIDFLLI